MLPNDKIVFLSNNMYYGNLKSQVALIENISGKTIQSYYQVIPNYTLQERTKQPINVTIFPTRIIEWCYITGYDTYEVDATCIYYNDSDMQVLGWVNSIKNQVSVGIKSDSNIFALYDTKNYHIDLNVYPTIGLYSYSYTHNVSVYYGCYYLA